MTGLVLLSCRSEGQPEQYQSTQKDFQFGADVLLNEKLDLLEGKNIGLITNVTGVLSNGSLLLDSLISHKIKIAAVFSPEHGFNLSELAGDDVPEAELSKKIKVFSLYGNTRKPAPSMLKGIDILIFDMQDIGARFYTYISTLYYVVEAAAENNIPLLVLDRPNPLGGLYVDGPVLEDEYKSFVGITNIPVVHGMTIGELALMFNDKISSSGKKAEIQIIKMKNWKRSFLWTDLGLNWVPTSPNIPNFETVLVYPATCFLEGTNISEGRGTYFPFITIGAPFIDQDLLMGELKTFGNNTYKITGTKFTPVDIEGMSVNPKYENELCSGIHIESVKDSVFTSVRFGVQLLYVINKLYPGKFEIKNYFNTLWGTEKIKKQLEAGEQPEIIFNSWQNDLNIFKQYRKQFLLY